MPKYTSPIWTEPTELFQERVNKCNSIAEILRSFDFAIGAAMYKMIYARIKRDNIDISHIPLGISSNKGRADFNRKPLEIYLVYGSRIRSYELKKRIIRDGLLINICAKCGLGDEWNGESISLQLDHINGNRGDNRLENLRILCPNCHSQTPTFCGKHKRKIVCCMDCNKKISNKKSKRCQSCASKTHLERPIKFNISKEELEKLVWEKSTLQLSKEFGVSDKTIENRCKKFGINKPPRGYWSKQRTLNTT